MNPVDANLTDSMGGARKVADIVYAYTQTDARWKRFREQVIRNYNYIIGDMVKPDVKAKLEKARRPVFEFQIASQPVEYIAGKLAKDSPRMKAIPVSQGDEESSELNTRVTNWGIGEKGYRAIAEASVDAVIAKIGYINTYWSTKDDPEGLLAVESLDPMLVLMDPEGRQLDRTDSDHRFRAFVPWLSAEEIIRIYGKYLTADQTATIQRNAESYEGGYKNKTAPKSWYSRVFNAAMNAFVSPEARLRSQGYISDFVRANDGLYRVIEWHDKRKITRKVALNQQSGETHVFPDDKTDDQQYEAEITQQMTSPASVGPMGLVSGSGAPVVETHTVELIYITSICPALLPDDVIMEQPYVTQGRGFSIKPVYFRRMHPDQTAAQSMVDRLIAPIDFYNQRMSTSLEAAMRAVNPDIIAPIGSIGPDDIESWESPVRNKLRWFKWIGTTKPEEVRPPTEAFQMLKALSEEGKDLVERVGGISPNARGYQESQQESGVLFNARVENTEVMIADFMRNVTETTRYVFMYANQCIKKHLTYSRTIRLLEDPNDEPEWITLNEPGVNGFLNDITQGEYDFVLDSEMMGQTTKRENARLLSQTSPLVAADPVVSMALAAKIYKSLDTPDGKELSQFIEKRIGMAMDQEAQSRVQNQLGAEMGLAAQAQKTLLPDGGEPPQGPQKQLPKGKAA